MARKLFEIEFFNDFIHADNPIRSSSKTTKR